MNKQTSGHYRKAALSLYAIAGVYLAALAWLVYVSVSVGTPQNFFATVFWLAMVLWCAFSVQKGSNKARKWSIFLFALHLLGGIFYIIFPGSIDLTFLLLVVIAISTFGLFHAWKGKFA